MATTTKTRTARTAKAATAAKTLPRDLDESDVIADAERMADELAAAAAKPARRRSGKAAPAAAPAQAETPAPAAAAAPKARSRKASPEAAAPQPQQPAQPVEDDEPTPKLNQATLVMAFLAQHPDEEFSPAAVSKAITPEGRKPLGVRDCMAKLAKAGKVVQTSDKPVRYRFDAA